MLSTTEVEARLRRCEDEDGKGIVITPNPFEMDRSQIGKTSVDLRLGRWFLALQQNKAASIDFGVDRKEAEFASKGGRSHYVPFGRNFLLHPGRFVLAATFEWVALPDKISAYISGKSLLGRTGLIIETAAGIHPGFSGCITLELSNVGEVPIAIYPGMCVCQLFFHEVKGDTLYKATKFGGRRKPTFGEYTIDAKLKKMIDNAAESPKLL